MKRAMQLPGAVKLIFDRFANAGHRADIVGGCTRDYLLGKAASDFDITTDATPDETKKIFADFRIVETGIKHGTVTVMVDGVPYEITTYRLDGEYKDHRRPEHVEFTRLLSEDLARRDFTVNAICYNENDGFTDLFGGLQDLSDKVIRAVGIPAKRFEEDALRILRAIRFAAVLGFSIDPETAKAAKDKRKLLCDVSAERIAVEWKKMLSGQAAYGVIVEYSDIISTVLPMMSQISLPKKERFESEKSDFIRELSIFAKTFGDGAADAYATAAEMLKYESKREKNGITLLNYRPSRSFCDDVGKKTLLLDLGREMAEDFMRLCYVLNCEYQDISVLRYLADNSVYTLSGLAVKGSDLMAAGIKGKEIGRVLNALLYAVVCEQCENTKDALLKTAKEI